VRQQNKPSVIKHSETPTPTQDSWWATELIQNLTTTYKHKLPQPTEGGADQTFASERQKKNKNKHYPTTWKDYNRAST
jgi:hypothetical protein